MPTVASKAQFQKHILKVLGERMLFFQFLIYKRVKLLGGCFSEYSSTIIKLKESINF